MEPVEEGTHAEQTVAAAEPPAPARSVLDRAESRQLGDAQTTGTLDPSTSHRRSGAALGARVDGDADDDGAGWGIVPPAS